MQVSKPNHVCRNPGCHKGEDGGRKAYYSCNACDRRKGIYWREWCCSIECYQEWILAQEKQQSEQEEVKPEPAVEAPNKEEAPVVIAEEPKVEENESKKTDEKSANPKKVKPEDSDDIPEGVKFVFSKKKHRD